MSMAKVVGWLRKVVSDWLLCCCCYVMLYKKKLLIHLFLSCSKKIYSLVVYPHLKVPGDCWLPFIFLFPCLSK
jgi:hypothetical protein